MESLAKLRAGLLLAAVTFTFAAGETRMVSTALPKLQTSSLFSQSAIPLLERRFPDSDVSFFLYDARSGSLLASRWPGEDQPILLGSLVKPFVALAYAQTYGFQYPVYECKGPATGCWQPQPHGKLDIVRAMSLSCNSYFRELASQLNGAQVMPVAREFGIEEPAAQLSGAELMGLGTRWKISPARMARAYLELNRRRLQPGIREIVEGMELSGKSGTGAAVDEALRHSRALVKTGTAPCTHHPEAPGDGFATALVPAERPELLIMVRVHGVPGAVAAKTAGRMLRSLEE